MAQIVVGLGATGVHAQRSVVFGNRFRQTGGRGSQSVS
jgi:hypothetical protein